MDIKALISTMMAGAPSPNDLSLLYRFGDKSDISTIYVCKDGCIITGHRSRLNIWTRTKDASEWCISNVLNTPIQGDVNSLCEINNKNQNLLAIAIDCTILCYDHQNLSLLHRVCFNEEEINQLAVNEKGTLLCACDDSGAVKIIDTDTFHCQKMLKAHDNICSTAKFIPRKPWELISGGLDCKVIRWDHNRGRPLSVLSQTELHDSDIGGYAVNPPMVHSLDVFPSSSTVACGLGNGAVSVYALKSGKQTELLCTATLHRSTISCVCAKEVLKTDSKALDQFVVSGGTDKMVCVSKLVVSESKKYTLELVGQVDNGSKIDWMVVQCENSEECRELTVFVVDLTCFVSAYRFSLC